MNFNHRTRQGEPGAVAYGGTQRPRRGGHCAPGRLAPEGIVAPGDAVPSRIAQQQRPALTL